MERITELIAAVGAARERVLDLTAGMTVEPAAEGEWTVTEILEHLVLAEMSGVTKICQAAESTRAGRGFEGENPNRGLPIEEIVARDLEGARGGSADCDSAYGRDIGVLAGGLARGAGGAGGGSGGAGRAGSRGRGFSALSVRGRSMRCSGWNFCAFIWTGMRIRSGGCGEPYEICFGVGCVGGDVRAGAGYSADDCEAVGRFGAGAGGGDREGGDRAGGVRWGGIHTSEKRSVM